MKYFSIFLLIILIFNQLLLSYSILSSFINKVHSFLPSNHEKKINTIEEILSSYSKSKIKKPNKGIEYNPDNIIKYSLGYVPKNTLIKSHHKDNFINFLKYIGENNFISNQNGRIKPYYVSTFV